MPLAHLRPVLLLACACALAAGEGTAHAPLFADRALWPDDVAKTAYARETWEAAPLYVWTATGKNGPETDPQDVANWTVDGKPATAPPDERSDIWFPAGSSIRLKNNTRLTARHITVGPGVRVVKPLGLRPLGNVWIHAGGSVEEMGSFGGAKNVFLRNDNRDFTKGTAGIANKIVFNKPIGSSIEIVGTVQAWDEMGFFCGTVIVGPGSELVPGNRSSQPVYPDATLVLLSGSSFHKRGNQPYETDLIVSGTLLAGTPERPLTSDCTLGLSFKAKGREDQKPPGAHGIGSEKDHGLIVNPKGTLRVHSADPAKARLVVTWNGLSSAQHKDPWKPDPAERHVDVILQGTVDLAGVCFDRIRAGGIKVADRAMIDKGRISYGERNAAPPAELVTVLDQPIEAKLVFSSASVPKPASQGGGGADNERETK